MSQDINIEKISSAFVKIAALSDLVKNHAFDHGVDNGHYYNFTFGTNSPRELWQIINTELYQHQELGEHMCATSMAVCSMEDGWQDYLQLYHFDPDVRINDVNEL